MTVIFITTTKHETDGQNVTLLVNVYYLSVSLSAVASLKFVMKATLEERSRDNKIFKGLATLMSVVSGQNHGNLLIRF